MESPTEINRADSQSGAGKQERSTIEFPYTDLDNGIEVVRGVHQAGGTACEYEQLAAALSLEAKGGGFRQRVNGARIFGLISYERGGRITLTELGRQVLSQETEKSARMNAFLAVELYKKVYEQFKGSPLPPQAGLERAIENMGVGAKVKDKARQVMLRSAKQAGFFDSAADRLVKPPLHNQGGKETPPPKGSGSDSGQNQGGDGGGRTYHPFIAGLLQELPDPGAEWPIQKRLVWLKTANGIFSMIYQTKDEDNGTIDINISSETNKAP